MIEKLKDLPVQKCILKRQIKFQDYKNCLNARETDKKSNWSKEKT